MALALDVSPRKLPVQARSVATMGVIHEATIQVLLARGLQGLTTARVAERAGVSVGTVYQYFPNKQAMLVAVLTQHLEHMIRAMEAVCAAQRGRSLESLAVAVVDAYVEAKLRRPDVSRALYALPSDAATDAVIASVTARGQLAVCDLLAGCADARFSEPSLVASVWIGSLIGPVQLVLTGALPMERCAAMRSQLVALSVAYLRTAAA
jgi:AcrR family transcriptional regulator